ncbi:uncharacterized protein LOC114280746, partial [Camellia sinensis]|uniref:uncharacterized protein LOC114280746 n=1 Tax=Camellia sinensis TaxID=4442 RepID=UPI0010366A10
MLALSLSSPRHFSLFKTKYGKSYATQEEHDYRLVVFKSNLRRAKRLQILDPSAVHGVTKFSDLTPAEFRHKFLGLKRPLKHPSDAQKVPFLRREFYVRIDTGSDVLWVSCNACKMQLHHLKQTTVTMFTTMANRPFFSASLADTGASIVDLPFPENINGLPAEVESTDELPSMSLFVPFANATKHIQPDLEKALEALSNVTCLISDGFLSWTLESATKFGIPRLA